MLNSIQALRALAAWLVVFHHYIQVVHSNNLQGRLPEALQVYGALGVDLFFIISGFVIYLSSIGKNITPGIFAMHRIARIVPAYWIYTGILATTLIIDPTFLKLTHFNTEFLLKSLFFIPTANPSGIGIYPLLPVGWTLNYEMIFYCVFLLSFYFPRKLQVITIAISLFLLSTVASHLGGEFSFYGNKIIYEFLFGIMIAILYKKGVVQKIPAFASFAMILIAIGMLIHFGQVSHDAFKTGIPCAMLLLSIVSLERFTPKLELLKNLGDWSYSTYLCHVLVMCFFMKIQKRFELNDGVTLVFIVMGILVVSYSSFRWVEKPISDLVKKSFKNPPKAEVSV